MKRASARRHLAREPAGEVSRPSLAIPQLAFRGLGDYTLVRSVPEESAGCPLEEAHLDLDFRVRMLDAVPSSKVHEAAGHLGRSF